MIILTSGHCLQASGCPLSSKDPTKEMEDRGSLDGENDLFRQRLQAKHVPNDDTLCRPSLGEGSTNRWGSLDWEDNCFFCVLTFSFKYVLEGSALCSEHHVMAGKGIILAVDDHICQLTQ